MFVQEYQYDPTEHNSEILENCIDFGGILNFINLTSNLLGASESYQQFRQSFCFAVFTPQQYYRYLYDVLHLHVHVPVSS